MIRFVSVVGINYATFCLSTKLIISHWYNTILEHMLRNNFCISLQFIPSRTIIWTFEPLRLWFQMSLGGGLVYHLFFICRSNRVAALLLCYHATALFTCKGSIGAGAICCLRRFVFYKQAFIGFSCYLGGVSCSLHYSTPFGATCSQPTTRR